jgi:hypothetical protein
LSAGFVRTCAYAPFRTRADTEYGGAAGPLHSARSAEEEMNGFGAGSVAHFMVKGMFDVRLEPFLE